MSGLVKIATLYERTSAKGTRYLGGALGPARVMLFENAVLRGNGEKTFSLCIAEVSEPAQATAGEAIDPVISDTTVQWGR